jgi:hypothetical protein
MNTSEAFDVGCIKNARVNISFGKALTIDFKLQLIQQYVGKI